MNGFALLLLVIGQPMYQPDPPPYKESKAVTEVASPERITPPTAQIEQSAGEVRDTQSRTSPSASDPWAGYVVVFYGAKWCPGCVAQKPFQSEINQKGLKTRRWKTYAVDVDQQKHYQWAFPKLTVLPAAILYQDNRAKHTWYGREITEQAIMEATKN